MNLLIFGKFQKQIRHPNYSSGTKHADIGLVELAENVKFTYFIWPACLHQGKEAPGKLDIAGFGLTKPESKTVKRFSIFHY